MQDYKICGPTFPHPSIFSEDNRDVMRLNPNLKKVCYFYRFANKQDVDGALSEQDVSLQFELEQLAKTCGSSYKVVSISKSAILKYSNKTCQAPYWEFYQIECSWHPK